jgi:three-Cys-motif partner protein
MRDANPGYWDEYSNLQHVKHALIKQYLGGWFPKLGFWSGRVLYIDTHAGKGRHKAGQAGSPLVALHTLLDHRFRDQILDRSEVLFYFVEIDEDNAALLEREIEDIGDLPARVYVEVTCDNCYDLITRELDALDEREKEMAPAFAFIDPYGFRVPGQVLNRLMAAGRVELFVNVIWRELDMAMAIAREQPDGGMAQTLDLVFDGADWRGTINGPTLDDRADQTVDLLRDVVGATWATSIRMLGPNRQTRYILVHFTNHEDGRELMKDAVWKLCPDGGYYARRSDNPHQRLLIAPQPDLDELVAWVREQLAEKPLRWAELSDRIRDQLWRKTHLGEVIRRLRRSGTIAAADYEGRFSEKANPMLEWIESESD